MYCVRTLCSAVIAVVLIAVGVSAQTTEFTYQGSLKDGVSLANGNYDFEFALFDALTGGSQAGSTLTRSPVAVSSGIFTVSLDFGNQFPGANRFLEIRVRPTGGGLFNTLLPRQQIDSAPYSVKSLNTDSATTATQLGGVAASQYVVTTDPRMTDSRSPTAGSTNYIQNQNAAPQASSNFNISGNGTVGGTLSGNLVNASTQYNLGGSRVLDLGFESTYLGIGAGQADTGSFNSFFGFEAGVANLAGGENSFFGYQAGKSNNGTSNSFFGAVAGFNTTGGGLNSFFGVGAGSANTNGTENTFVGASAGNTNTTGSNNTVVGRNADVASNNLNFATAIGAFATVSTSNTVVLGRAADTVQVPGILGALNVAGLVKREYTAATFSSAIPIAYGSINAAGGILSGTGNFTVAHTVTGEYNITITGETYSNDGFTVTITPVTNSPRINGVADAGAPFRVNMWNLAGTLVDNAFQFTIWKTNPN